VAHLHLPDGVFPYWLWGAAYVAVGAALLWLGWRFRRGANLRLFARAGFFAALMVVAMSFHLAPLGYHLNLAALAGIVAGPTAALLACLFANVLLALLGHGGVTVIALNTLTLGAEALAAGALFRLASFVRPVGPRAFAATWLALALATTLAFAIVVVGTRDFGGAVHRGGGWVHVELYDRGEEAEPAEAAGGPEVSTPRLAALFYGLGAIGWTLEALVVAGVVAYVKRAAPRLVPG